MNRFERARNAYIKNCESNEQSFGTIENDKMIFKLFEESMQRNGHDDICLEAVRDWKYEMSERGIKVTTMNLYMGVCRVLCKWAVEMKYLDDNPFTSAIMPNKKAVSRSKSRQYENLMTKEEYFKIVNCKERPPRQKAETWERDRAILLVFMMCGLRNSELRALTINDLNFAENTVTVRHGKGDKFRITVFPQEAQNAVTEYLRTDYRPSNLTNDDLLFGISKDGEWRRMDRTHLSEEVKQTVGRILDKDGVRTHALRHAFASIAYDYGIPLDEIRDLLGHASVSTTEVYAERLRPKAPTESANKMFMNMFGGNEC